MPEAQINLRRQPLPTNRRLPSDQFRYGGVFVAIAVVAALIFAFMMREPVTADSVGSVQVSDLPQIQN